LHNKKSALEVPCRIHDTSKPKLNRPNSIHAYDPGNQIVLESSRVIGPVKAFGWLQLPKDKTRKEPSSFPVIEYLMWLAD